MDDYKQEEGDMIVGIVCNSPPVGHPYKSTPEVPAQHKEYYASVV
jgi:hypothetical protein